MCRRNRRLFQYPIYNNPVGYFYFLPFGIPCGAVETAVKQVLLRIDGSNNKFTAYKSIIFRYHFQVIGVVTAIGDALCARCPETNLKWVNPGRIAIDVETDRSAVFVHIRRNIDAGNAIRACKRRYIPCRRFNRGPVCLEADGIVDGLLAKTLQREYTRK